MGPTVVFIYRQGSQPINVGYPIMREPEKKNEAGQIRLV